MPIAPVIAATVAGSVISSATQPQTDPPKASDLIDVGDDDSV